MNRVEKGEFIAEIREELSAAQSVVVAHYSGLTVAEVTELRNAMREAGAKFKVTKNRLTRLALEGSEFEGISELLTGPTAIAYSSDPVAAAKAASEFAKKNEKLVVLGGAMPGQILDAKGVDALAKLPSLDQLRGKLIGVLQAPATKVAGVAQAPASQLARVFQAYAKEGEAA